MKNCASPITTAFFLTQATLHGQTDYVDSPSANLTTENVNKMGTGMMDICYMLDIFY